mgnify:FL=1
MQSQIVKEEIGFEEDGIRNGNIATSGVKTVPISANEEKTIATPALSLLTLRKEIRAPTTASAGNVQRTG